MKKLNGEVSVSELDEYFLNEINGDSKYSVEDYYDYVEFMEDEDRSILDDVEEDDLNYETLTDLQMRTFKFIEGTMDITEVVLPLSNFENQMNNCVDVVEIDMVTFEPIETTPYFYLDDPYLWSQNAPNCFNEYVDSLTYMYRSIVKSMNGSSANHLGLCTESYNQFLYFETNPQKSFQKFLSEKLSFDYEEVDGYFNIQIYGPPYLKNMVESLRSKNVH